MLPPWRDSSQDFRPALTLSSTACTRAEGVKSLRSKYQGWRSAVLTALQDYSYQRYCL